MINVRDDRDIPEGGHKSLAALRERPRPLALFRQKSKAKTKAPPFWGGAIRFSRGPWPKLDALQLRSIGAKGDRGAIDENHGIGNITAIAAIWEARADLHIDTPAFNAVEA